MVECSTKNKLRNIVDTPFYSKLLGALPTGCRMCVKGEKMVLYATGVCPRSCWYCPLGENRKDQDVIFSNEATVKSFEDIVEECEMSQAKGCGITGGDPLARLDRTVEYIVKLKEKFGSKFHIHLYTTFVLCSAENMKRLYDAGLDEIRFHPDFDKLEDMMRIDNALKYDWEVGIEIPCIPRYEKQIFEMIDYMEGKNVSFLNVNEFEVAGTNMDKMEEEGYEAKDIDSHGVEGSDELGDKILEYCQDKKINVHYCSSTLKDRVQMTNRYKLRAEKVKTKFDEVTEDGQLYRGCIYLKGFALRDMLSDEYKSTPREEIIKKLNEKKEFLEEEGLELIVDEKKLRLITYPEHVEQFAEVLNELDLVPALVEEDPTVKAYETDIDYL